MISNYGVFDSSNIGLKVLKGSGTFIEHSHASDHETKQLVMSIKQVLANTAAQCFFCKAHTAHLIGVINILTMAYGCCHWVRSLALSPLTHTTNLF